MLVVLQTYAHAIPSMDNRTEQVHELKLIWFCNKFGWQQFFFISTSSNCRHAEFIGTFETDSKLEQFE